MLTEQGSLFFGVWNAECGNNIYILVHALHTIKSTNIYLVRVGWISFVEVRNVMR